MNISSFVRDNLFWIIVLGGPGFAIIQKIVMDIYNHYNENFCHKCRSKNFTKFNTYDPTYDGKSSKETQVLVCKDCGHETRISRVGIHWS